MYLFLIFIIICFLLKNNDYFDKKFTNDDQINKINKNKVIKIRKTKILLRWITRKKKKERKETAWQANESGPIA